MIPEQARARRAWLATALLLVVGCHSIPKDPGGTLERVLATKRFTVGMIAPGPGSDDSDPRRILLSRLAARTGATPHVQVDAAERVLSRLERGELDLVIGDLADDSPWHSRVTLLPPLVAPATAQAVVPAVAARNGENAWIAVLFREITAVTGGAS